VNFKEYFLKEFFEDNSFDPYLKNNTGSHHHQTTGRVTRMGQRKGLNLIAKSQSQPKKTLHPKIDLCLKTKKDVPLVGNESVDIMKKYGLCPTKDEPIKAIKKMPVSLKMVNHNVYILCYRGGI
jgi:hypothetical protein